MRPERTFDRLLIVAIMLVIFFLITMLSAPLLLSWLNLAPMSREGLLFSASWQAVMMFVAPSLVSAKILSARPMLYLQLNRAPSFLSILGVLFAYLIALPFLNQVIFWNESIVFPESMARWEEVLRELEDSALNASKVMLGGTGVGTMLVNLSIVGLLTAFAEELFFRGTLQHTAAGSDSPHTAIWVVALFFSAFHLQIFGFVPRLLLGAWFGYLLFWTRSVYVPVIAHFINNGVVVVCVWLNSTGVDYDFEKFGVTESGFPMPAFVSALAFIVFVIYFRNLFFGNSRRREESSEPSPEYV